MKTDVSIRRLGITFGVAVLHFALSYALLFVSVAIISRDFDEPGPSNPIGPILLYSVMLLQFPAFVLGHIPLVGRLISAGGPLQFIITSILFGMVAAGLVDRWHRNDRIIGGKWGTGKMGEDEVRVPDL